MVYFSMVNMLMSFNQWALCKFEQAAGTARGRENPFIRLICSSWIMDFNSYKSPKSLPDNHLFFFIQDLHQMLGIFRMRHCCCCCYNWIEFLVRKVFLYWWNKCIGMHIHHDFSIANKSNVVGVVYSCIFYGLITINSQFWSCLSNESVF